MSDPKAGKRNPSARKGSHGGPRKRRRSDHWEKKGKRSSGRQAFEVFYGGDISDPLNLNCEDPEQDAGDSQSGDEQAVEAKVVLDPIQISDVPRTEEDPLNILADARRQANKERKKRLRKLAAVRREEKRKQSTGDEEEKAERLVRRKRRRRKSQSKDDESTADDEVGKSSKRRRRHRRMSSSKDGYSADEMAEHTFRPQDAKFTYGNYNRYYGYRNPSGQSDERLKCLPKSVFADKSCLDIGCNTGQMTLSLARDFAPSSIVGIDIDSDLIETAAKNVRHYMVPSEELTKSLPEKRTFPKSFKLAYGPLVSPFVRPPVQPIAGKVFPLNCSFKQENYVVDSMGEACAQTEEHGTILALSVTKWIHLNWGDEGIRAFFHRAYHHLKPGGYFILEPQLWPSYHRKSKLTQATLAHYHTIRLRPEMFDDYLLNQVGFSSLESLPVPKHEAKGFQRPMHLYSKSKDSDRFCHRCRPIEAKSARKNKKSKANRGVRLSGDIVKPEQEATC